MLKIILAIFIVIITIGCEQRDSVEDIPCEYFFNEFHIESTDIIKYKSFTVFLNFVDGISDGNLYFISYDLIHFNMEINLDSSICIDSSTKIRIFFNDGSTSEYFSRNESNCDGELSIPLKSLTPFKGKIIDRFQITNNDELITFDLDQKTQNKYEKMSNCFFKVVNEKVNRL